MTILVMMIPRAGRVLNLAQDELTELNVSDTALDRLIQVARQNGALGANRLAADVRYAACLHLRFPGCSQAGRNLKQHGAVETWIQPLAKGDE